MIDCGLGVAGGRKWMRIEKREMAATQSLSDLPENVIGEILSHLPIEDAVSTSILSQSWRHRWRSIPDLDLSEMPDNDISQALRLHGVPIRLFKAQTTDRSAVDRWLASLSRSSSSSLCALDLAHSFSIQLSTLADYFSRLTHLHLATGNLDTLSGPDCSEFPALETLHLEHVEFLTDQTGAGGGGGGDGRLSMFVPNCPLLETLIVYHTNLDGGYFCYNLRSIARDFPRLAHLELSFCELDIILPSSSGFASLRALDLAGSVLHGNLSVLFSACPLLESLTLNYVDLAAGAKWVDLVAPNLRRLKLVRVGEFGDFSIASAPVLEMVVLGLLVRNADVDDGGSSNLIKTLGNMPLVKKLQLHHETLMFLGRGCVPEKFPVGFDHLRCLSLKVDFRVTEAVLVTCCLLRSSPNLQELDFEGCCYYEREFFGVGKDFWKAQEQLDLFDNLETVNMTVILCVEAELEFIQFVLFKARQLKTMMISFLYMRKMKLVMERILEFPVASNRAQIMFNTY